VYPWLYAIRIFDCDWTSEVVGRVVSKTVDTFWGSSVITLSRAIFGGMLAWAFNASRGIATIQARVPPPSAVMTLSRSFEILLLAFPSDSDAIYVFVAMIEDVYIDRVFGEVDNVDGIARH
jgi:hypothetical protein